MADNTIIRNRKGVTANYRTGSAREAYASRMAQFVGRPLQEFVDSCAEDVPSVPGKGKLEGKPEPITGWVAFLTGEQGPFTLASK